MDATEKAALQSELVERFFNVADRESKQMLKVLDMMERRSTRLVLSITDLREWNRERAHQLITSPLVHLPVLEEAAKQVVLRENDAYFTEVAAEENVFLSPGREAGSGERIHIGLDGNFGLSQVTPRSLTADHLCHMVAVEGIVTKCFIVRPKVARSVHYCPDTKSFTSREYRDATDLTGTPTGSVYPQKDEQGHRLETEFGLCSFRNSQTVTIQEMPESSPLGQLPRSVDVYLENDLVDCVKPGDRVCVIGIYRALHSGTGTSTNGVFRTMLLANHVSRVSKETGALKLTGGDVKNIRGMAMRPDAFNLLSRSLAPSIYGHKYLKQALALLMLSGVEKNLANGTHIRGDINILMVGDPSTAKSQLLRFVLNIAPLAVNTTGRGSTGVGLTAAVTSDPETGERRLEAGAMVLADRGVVCIDEFDKMSDADRVAIHEVMEQQTVTIAKAGLQASLNARCSVVAAANPIYGRFDNRLPLSRNVALPDSLLSRFDLVFIVRDRIEETIDSRLAGHVLRMHRYVRPGSEGVPIPLNATAMSEGMDDDRAIDEDADTPVFQKYNPVLHGGAADEARTSAAVGRGVGEGGAGAGGDDAVDDREAAARASAKFEVLTMDFIRKFVSYAKLKCKPRLTNGARASIIEYYNDFRQRNRDRATVITARSLETLIRLSSAHAKCRLSEKVDKRDVEVARDIMQFALYADAKLRKDEGMRSAAPPPKRPAPATPASRPPPAPPAGGGGSDHHGSNDGVDGGGGGGGGGAVGDKRRRPDVEGGGEGGVDWDAVLDEGPGMMGSDGMAPAAKRGRPSGGGGDDDEEGMDAAAGGGVAGEGAVDTGALPATLGTTTSTTAGDDDDGDGLVPAQEAVLNMMSHEDWTAVDTAPAVAHAARHGAFLRAVSRFVTQVSDAGTVGQVWAYVAKADPILHPLATDTNLFRAHLAALVQDGKLMISDGIVYHVV